MGNKMTQRKKAPKRKIKRVARIKILTDKIGKYILFKGKKFRLGKNVGRKRLAQFLVKKAREEVPAIRDDPEGRRRAEQELVEKQLEEIRKAEEYAEIQKILKNPKVPALVKEKLRSNPKIETLRHQYKRLIGKEPSAEMNRVDLLRDIINKEGVIQRELERQKRGEAKEERRFQRDNRRLGRELDEEHKKEREEKKRESDEEFERYQEEMEAKMELVDEIKALQPRTVANVDWTIPELQQRLKLVKAEANPAFKRYMEKGKREEKVREEIANDPLHLQPHPALSLPQQSEEKKVEAQPAPTDVGDLTGGGTSKIKIPDDDKGLSNDDIDKIMGKYPSYLGCIAHNEFDKFILPKVQPRSKGAFVYNTDPASKSGEHWVCVYFDATPTGEQEIDYFDSFAEPADRVIRRDIKKLAHKLDANTYLKFKENRVRLQNGKSDNCGWFCCQFLIDRMRGKRFKDASGYTDIQRGESSVEAFKRQRGFGYVASFN